MFFFVISQNTKLDALQFWFREILRNDFAEILQNTFNISQNFFVLLFSQKKFCKFRQILISRNEFKIVQNFAKPFLYFAKFCHVIGFAKEILRYFVKYLFLKMILPKFRKIFFFFHKMLSQN